MPLFIGNKEADMVKIGEKEIAQIYLGIKELWTNAKAIYLSSGKNWDLKTLYPNLYTKITANDIFYKTVNQASGYIGVRMGPNDEREWHGFVVSVIKSYDPSTGALTAYNSVRDSQRGGQIGVGSSEIVPLIIPNSEKAITSGKIVRLGDINGTYDLKTAYADDYMHFTNDNFIIRSTSAPGDSGSFYPQGYAYSGTGYGTSTITKSYDASTGILTARIRQASYNVDDVYTWFNYSHNGTVEVFLMPKLL